MKIGKYDISGGVLAPMAGYTDIAFRALCKKYGAGLTVSEMVSVRGLVHGNATTDELLRRGETETPYAVQLFGNDPHDFERVVKDIDADIIDINMGCPMPKIVKNGDGAALLKNPRLAGDIVRAVKNSTDKPVTVKTRLGYGIGNDSAAALIKEVQKAGATAVAVHGRYAEQRYAGDADIAKIAELARNVDLPIIVNGDLKSVELDCCAPFAAAMIGRAALKNPAVFSGGAVDPFGAAREHLDLLCKYFDEYYSVIQARKFFVHYFKGVPGGKDIREKVNRATRVQEVYDAIAR